MQNRQVVNVANYNQNISVSAVSAASHSDNNSFSASASSSYNLSGVSPILVNHIQTNFSVPSSSVGYQLSFTGIQAGYNYSRSAFNFSLVISDTGIMIVPTFPPPNVAPYFLNLSQNNQILFNQVNILNSSTITSNSLSNTVVANLIANIGVNIGDTRTRIRIF